MGKKKIRVENEVLTLDPSIDVSGYEFVGGIDVHKEKCAIFIVYAEHGDIPHDAKVFADYINRSYRRVKSDAEGFEKLLGDLSKAKKVFFLMENSTKSHEIYRILTSFGIETYVAHSTDLFRITRSTRKNDDRDARELAFYMRRKLYGEVEFALCHMPDAKQMERKQLCRFLADLREGLSVLKRQARMRLLIAGRKTSREYSDISCASARKEFMAMEDNVLAFIAKRMEQTIELIRFGEKVILNEFSDDRTFQIIYSIPGFGIHSAAYITSEIMDIGRFPNKQRFSGYFGVRPKQDDSADSQNDKHISRRGDALARRLCFQATFVHINHVEESNITLKYQRLRAKGKVHKEATIACTNSMFMMIYTMVKHDTAYTCNKDLLKLCREKADSMDINDLDGSSGVQEMATA